MRPAGFGSRVSFLPACYPPFWGYAPSAASALSAGARGVSNVQIVRNFD